MSSHLFQRPLTVELINRAGSVPAVKTKLGAKVKLRKSEVLLYNGVDGYMAHINLRELTGNASRSDQY